MTFGSRALAIGLVRTVAVAAAMLMVTVLTVSRSQAVFTASTTNSGSSFTAGTVVLTDDDSGTALFSATGMTPGNPLVACITVTYSGDQVPAPVRLHATTTGTLDTYLDTTIEVGTGGSFGSCAGFSVSSTPYTGTLANLSTTYTDYASGLALFTASSNPTARTIRVTIDVQNNDAAQGLSSTAALTFESQV